MDFQVSEDRRMLQDSLQRYLAAHYSIEHRNIIAYQAPFHDPKKWQDLAELGILYALLPPEAGGMGGTGFDVSAVFEMLGRSLCVEPMLAAAMSSTLLLETEIDLSSFLDGSKQYAVAIQEPDQSGDISIVNSTAEFANGGYRLSGKKSMVYGGQSADKFLVAASLNNKTALFEVRVEDVVKQTYGLIDGGGAVDLILDDSPAQLIETDAETLLRKSMNIGILALCSEAVGLMDASMEMMLDYLRTRKQFGREIGKFQAIQHRVVNLTIEIEQCRSIVILAASHLGGPEECRTMSMAKYLIGRTVKQVAEETIQLQGGIGMTWEYPSSHYAKRLAMLDHQLGDADLHLSRLVETLS